MKKTILAIVIYTSSIAAFAMPFVCKSTKLIEDKPVVYFKISANSPNYTLYRHLKNHLIGLTTHTGDRFVLSADGRENSSGRITFSFVKASFLQGFLVVGPSESGEKLRGDFRHTNVSHETFEVECDDLGEGEDMGFKQVNMTGPRTRVQIVTTKTKIKIESVEINL